MARLDPVLQIGLAWLLRYPLCTLVTSEESLGRHGRKQRVLSCLSCPACCFEVLMDLAIDLLPIWVELTPLAST